MEQPAAAQTAQRIRRSEFAGKGCLIQGFGLLLPFLGFVFAGPVGLLLGLIVMIPVLLSGSRASFRWECGECGNPIAGKQVKLCPTCGARFK
jgi:hypothetical protein